MLVTGPPILHLQTRLRLPFLHLKMGLIIIPGVVEVVDPLTTDVVKVVVIMEDGTPTVQAKTLILLSLVLHAGLLTSPVRSAIGLGIPR